MRAWGPISIASSGQDVRRHASGERTAYFRGTIPHCYPFRKVGASVPQGYDRDGTNTLQVAERGFAMGTDHSSRRRRALMIVAGAALFAFLLTGCHSESRLVSTRTSEVCPTCEVQTRVQPITGLTYTRCVCPSCNRVSTLDETTRMHVERYVGGQVGETVHVCDTCESLVGECAICEEMRGG